MELKEQIGERMTSTKRQVQTVANKYQNKLAATKNMRVTHGGFGRTLERFMKKTKMPSSTVGLLRRSPDFKKLAGDLDKKYEDFANTTKYNPRFDHRNRIVKGDKGMPPSYKGKMDLIITEDGEGANFMGANSPDNGIGVDIISVRHLSRNRFIQEIVHEACHAYNFAYASGSVPKDLIAAIRADTQEEIKVRKRENKILKEINKGLKTPLKFNSSGSTTPAVVGRNFSPGLGLTYLENSFFAFRLNILQAKEKLSDDQAKFMREKVSKKRGLPFMPFPDPETGLYELSEYGKTWSDRLKAQKSWRQFNRGINRNNPDAREARIMKHAKNYFKGLVRYSKLPS